MECVDLLDFELTFCNSSMKQMRSSNLITINYSHLPFTLIANSMLNVNNTFCKHGLQPVKNDHKLSILITYVNQVNTNPVMRISSFTLQV